MSTAPVAFTLPAAALLLLVAVLSAVTAYRGWTGRLTRASRLGVHSPAASASDESFALANRVAAPVVAGAAAIAVVLGALVVILPFPALATVVLGTLSVAAVVGLLIAGGVVGEQAARTLPVPARRPQPSAACTGCACGGDGCAGLTRGVVPAQGTAPEA